MKLTTKIIIALFTAELIACAAYILAHAMGH